MPTRKPTRTELTHAAALVFPLSRAELVAQYGRPAANRIIWAARVLGRKIQTVQAGKSFTYEEQKGV